MTRHARYLTVVRERFGDPGVRDPDFPCRVFEPGTPSARGDCWSDGHYLCSECARYLPPSKDDL